MTPALVLGAGHSTTLEVIRILGRRGIPQFAVGAGESFVSRSRWYRGLPGQQQGTPDPSSLPALLARLAFERMVLIPCTDEWVLAVARLEPGLAARFPASLAPRESVEMLLDKGRFAQAVQGLGVPHPRTLCLESEDDLAALPDSALRHAFLKPRVARAFFARYGVKAFRFETRSQAVDLVREASRAGFRLVLQEYIPGPASRYYFVNGFVDRTGIVSVFVTHRLRMFPPDFGDTCYGVSVRPEEVPVAMEVATRLLRALRFRGVFDIEFKHDPRDGLFKVLEINARPYGFIGFAPRSGVDLVAMAYQDALDLQVEPVAAYAAGRHYVDPYADRSVAWRMVREGTLTPWSWAGSWLGAYQPVFSWDDPLPAGVDFTQRVRSFFQRSIRTRAR